MWRAIGAECWSPAPSRCTWRHGLAAMPGSTITRLGATPTSAWRRRWRWAFAPPSSSANPKRGRPSAKARQTMPASCCCSRWSPGRSSAPSWRWRTPCRGCATGCQGQRGPWPASRRKRSACSSPWPWRWRRAPCACASAWRGGRPRRTPTSPQWRTSSAVTGAARWSSCCWWASTGCRTSCWAWWRTSSTSTWATAKRPSPPPPRCSASG